VFKSVSTFTIKGTCIYLEIGNTCTCTSICRLLFNSTYLIYWLHYVVSTCLMV